MFITIVSSVLELETSILFYQKLGFTKISDQPLIYSDGILNVELNANSSARAGLKFYSSNIHTALNIIKDDYKIFDIDNDKFIIDDTGTWLYFQEIKKVKNTPIKKSKLGNFMGLSLESDKIDKLVNLYSKLGFKIDSEISNENFKVLTNSIGFNISLMSPLSCPHSFHNPSLTFFNGENNNQIINKLRKFNVDIFEEITIFNEKGDVDNIIIRDPGGYHFFIFND